ncbi:agarase [Cryobacterium sp. HLT2-28]|uniref:agarase n=1 Tax=Cryobacterium sp. HLT2-28 TaxID=1259146 RepID=UPI00106DD232|nr:agarase [Cryobacterium sp. HLT2-28]TFB91445.1 agarase [Cryobacterium sp. HLT2-28]
MAAPENPGTRFFTVAQSATGSWSFIDPEGKPFVSLGVNHIDDSDLRYPHNVDVWNERYGSRQRWEQGVVADLQSLNFNTIGWTSQYISGGWGEALDWFGDPVDLGHSYPWPDRDLLEAGMPYVVQLRVQEIEDWNGHPAYRDVYGEDFAKYADWLARRMTSDHKDSSNLIGYFLVDIPGWIPHAAGRFWPGFDGLSPEEHDAKLHDVAQQYYKIITEAIRRYDPNHLILGDRYNGNKGIPEVVLRAMTDYVDVLSVQYFTGKSPEEYATMIGDLRNWQQLTGKPVLIADIGNWVPTAMNPHRTSDMETQEERGQDYASGLATIMQEPWIVGWHWCGYIENLGRGWGIKDPQDNFYTDMTDPMRAANAAAQTTIADR